MTRGAILMVAAILAAVPACATGAGAGAAAPAGGATAEPWELVGRSGWIRMVYIDPARLGDKELLARIVKTVLDETDGTTPIQIDFFDDRAQTPATKPYQKSQIIHIRAKYNFNPKNGMRRFVRVEFVPVDPNEPNRLRAKETEETLPSP